MSGGTCAEDTLWIVLEPDFCVFEVDAKARMELIMERLGDEKSNTYEDFAAKIENESARVRFLSALTEWRRERKEKGDYTAWPHVPLTTSKAASSTGTTAKGVPPPPKLPPPSLPKRKKAEELQTRPYGCARALLDLVLYFNASAKAGRGGLLWTGWNAEQWGEGKKCRQMSPSSGAQCVMLTTKAARFLCSHKEEIPDMHMGNFLSKLCGLKWQEELGAAYLVPPVGSYVAHTSTTTPGTYLQDHFSAKWSQEGTSITKETDSKRWICAFTEKGPPKYLHQEGIDTNLSITRDSLVWLTQALPGMDKSVDGMEEWFSQWRLAGDGKQRHQGDVFMMIKDLAKEAEATRHEDDPAFAKEKVSDFAKRLLRLHVMQYSHREFAEPDSPVFDMPWKIPQYIGKNEIENSYKLRGFVIPDDEEAHTYFSNRRLESNKYEVWGNFSMWKSCPAENQDSPSRKTSRSKLPAALGQVPLSAVAKLAAVPSRKLT